MVYGWPELDGFIKAFKPFKEMGIGSIQDITARRAMKTSENVEHTMKAVVKRCDMAQSTCPHLSHTFASSLSPVHVV